MARLKKGEPKKETMFTIRLTDEEYNKLLECSRVTGINRTDLILRVIDFMHSILKERAKLDKIIEEDNFELKNENLNNL